MDTYATKDELNKLTTYVKACQNSVSVLNDTVAELNTLVGRINHVSTMKDTTITYLCEGDVLLYNTDGTWHNVRPGLLSTYGSIDEEGVQLILRRDGAKLFVSKVDDDTVKGVITFKKGLTAEDVVNVKGDLVTTALRVGDYTQGLSGAVINSDGSVEFGSVVVRNALTVPELNYNKITTTTGEIWHAPYSGVIKEVDTENKVCTVKLEEGEYCNVQDGDICRAIFHYTEDNNSTTIDDSCGFPQYEGFTTIYFSVGQSDESSFQYTLMDGCDKHPHPGMSFVVYGNFTNTSRQSSAYSTPTYTRYLKGVNTWKITADNIASQFGKLDGLIVKGAPNDGKLTGDGAYIDNVYLTGALVQFTPEQKELLKEELADSSTYTVMRCRGEYDSEKIYYYALLNNIPDEDKEGYTDSLDSERCYIRDYVYYKNQAYMVKTAGDHVENVLPTDTEKWSVSSLMSFASINTLLAENAKLGEFNVSNNVFISSNGKLSMNSETGKVVAKDIEISGTSTAKNIVLQLRIVDLYFEEAYYSQRDDGYYTIYEDATKTTVKISKATGITSNGRLRLQYCWIDPDIATVYQFTYQEGLVVILPSPHNYYGTIVKLYFTPLTTAYGVTGVAKIIADYDNVEIDSEYDSTKIKYLSVGGYDIPDLQYGMNLVNNMSRERYVEVTAMFSDWCVSQCNIGFANQSYPVVFAFQFNDDDDNLKLVGMDSIYDFHDASIAVTKSSLTESTGGINRVSSVVTTNLAYMEKDSYQANAFLRNSPLECFVTGNDNNVYVAQVDSPFGVSHTGVFKFRVNIAKLLTSSSQSSYKPFFIVRLCSGYQIKVPKNNVG